MPELAPHPTRVTYPSLTTLLPFLTSLLISPRTKSPLIYHQLPPTAVSSSSLDPRVHTVLLSITPDPRVYQLLHTHRPEILFLHHPWKLDRSKVPEETVVVTSHEAFDDRFTTGWNTALARRLGVVDGSGDQDSLKSDNQGDDEGFEEPKDEDGLKRMVCLKGHKGEKERRIGLVGWFPEVECREFVGRVEEEFGGAGEMVLFGAHAQTHERDEGDIVKVEGVKREDNEDHRLPGDTQVDTLACLNAFTAEIIERVMAAAPMAKGVVVVTGERKEAGMKRARELGVKAVVCVGHKRCEVWGLHYVAEQIRNFAENEVGTIVVEE